MSPRDNEIWQRWIAKHEQEIDRVFYNVRVGGGSTPSESTDPETVLAWLMLTMLRLDAVVETKDHVLLIEVRPDAGRSLYGALMIYHQLWSVDPKISKPFFSLGVTNNATTQIRSIFELNNLRLEVV